MLTPHTGPPQVINRAVRYHPSTAMLLANDLHKILQPEEAFVMAIVDGGSDWSVKSLITLIYMGRVWKSLGLDGFVITSYCAGFSAFNPVEQYWAPLNRSLSAVTLSATAPGDSVAVPFVPQSECDAEQRNEKTKVVVDKSMD